MQYPIYSSIRTLFCLFLLLLNCHIFWGQSNISLSDFGKISDKEFRMNSYPNDTSASAVVLFDHGDYLNRIAAYTRNVYTKHTRLKILSSEGYAHLPQKIRIFAPNNSNKLERILNFRASTYNIENGKIEVVEVGKNELMEVKEGNGWYEYVFAFPKVKVGSIVELKYEVESDWDFPTWNFQYDIPVIWSELTVSYPRNWVYHTILQNTDSLFINENNLTKKSLITHARYVLKNVPAIREEPFINTIEDYRIKLIFEVASVEYAGGAGFNQYSCSWKGLCNDLLEGSNYAYRLKEFTRVNELAQEILKETSDTLEMIKNAHEHILYSMDLNGVEGLFERKDMNALYDQKRAGASSINLMLLKLLKNLGINASPLIISTRENGKVYDIVSLNQFNYTLIYVNYAGGHLLLDATDKTLPFPMIPFKCLNYQGRLIDEQGGKWVNIIPTTGFREVAISEMKFTEDDGLAFVTSFTFSGYSATQIRNIRKEDSDFMKRFISIFNNVKVDTAYFQIEKDYSHPLVFNIKGRFQNSVHRTANLLSFNPILFLNEEENMFQGDTRHYPIDFGTSTERLSLTTFSIPNSFIVESLPRNQRISLPNDMGAYLFSTQVKDGTISVSSKLVLKKSFFTVEEYKGLKEFYEKVLAKQQEPIVLKLTN